ncbi:MAG TPA: hypothetical protein VLG76_03405 [Rhabdochlamydiaceae bacterium]|nr:hypothetical protein [Rhabdochlamydiaceae bacterium]
MSALAISSHRETTDIFVRSDQKQTKFTLIDPSYLKKADLQAGGQYDSVFRALKVILIASVVLVAAVTAGVAVFAYTASYAAVSMTVATVAAIGTVFGYFALQIK